jgi:hypothetical protein
LKIASNTIINNNDFFRTPSDNFSPRHAAVVFIVCPGANGTQCDADVVDTCNVDFGFDSHSLDEQHDCNGMPPVRADGKLESVHDDRHLRQNA